MVSFDRPVWAEISLSSLRHNMRQIRSLLKPGVIFCPIIKADGYGHGAVSYTHLDVYKRQALDSAHKAAFGQGHHNLGHHLVLTHLFNHAKKAVFRRRRGIFGQFARRHENPRGLDAGVDQLALGQGQGAAAFVRNKRDDAQAASGAQHHFHQDAGLPQ